MNQSNIKYLAIPFGILVIIIGVALLIPKRKTVSTSIESPTPTLRQFPTPTPYSLLPDDLNTPSPTLIPLQFTGADLSQDIPSAIKSESDQKTVLRRLTPLTLPFGVVDFSYENDIFIVMLSNPKADALAQFNTWRIQTYPALSENKFVIN